MRVQFNYSLEDIVDASLRFQARSRSASSLRLKRRIWGALFVWAIVIVIFRFTINGVIGGLVGALVAMAIDPFLYQHQLRKNLRKRFREMYGEQNQFICEVELSPEALKTSSKECQNTTAWAKLEEVVPTSDSVDIFGPAAAVIVRNRAFTSAEERQRFIDLAREYLNQARGS